MSGGSVVGTGGERRGWCPTARVPMESGDGWLVRARVGCRAVTAEQWRVVAGIAAGPGRGRFELTARGNLQLRGLERRATGPAAERLDACGLAGPDEASDRRRSVVLNPLDAAQGAAGSRAVVERLEAAETGAVVERIEAAVARCGAGLAPKWWAVVDGGRPWPVPLTGCDLALRRDGGRWVLVVAGRVVVVGGDPVDAALALIERCAAGGARARDLLAPLPDTGPPAADVVARPGSVEPGAAPSPVPGVIAALGPPAADAARPGVAGAGRSPVAEVGVPGGSAAVTPWWGIRDIDGRRALSVAPPLGVADAAAAAVLADLADTSAVTVHPTPQRGVVALAGPGGERELSRARDDLAALGWIVDGADPRRHLSACIGSNGCDSALLDTHRAVAALVATGAVSGRTHLSGCPKRCGAPAGVRELMATDHHHHLEEQP